MVIEKEKSCEVVVIRIKESDGSCAGFKKNVLRRICWYALQCGRSFEETDFS